MEAAKAESCEGGRESNRLSTAGNGADRKAPSPGATALAVAVAVAALISGAPLPPDVAGVE